MSNVFTIESLNDELNRQYAPFTFQAGREKFVLRQVLRLPETERDLVFTQLQELDKAQDDHDVKALEAVVWTVLKTVVDGGKGDRLKDVLNSDLASAMVLVNKWMESTQVGEAEDSPN